MSDCLALVSLGFITKLLVTNERGLCTTSFVPYLAYQLNKVLGCAFPRERAFLLVDRPGHTSFRVLA